MKKRLFVIILLLLSIFSLAMVPKVEDAQKIIILGEPDVTNFPQVSVNFRALSKDGNALENLLKDQISITEDSIKTRITSLQQNPTGSGLNLYFVVDQYNRTDSSLVSKFFKRYSEKYMVDGLDQVTVVTNETRSAGRTNPYVLLDKTSSVAEFNAFANSYSNQKSFEYVNDALMEAYTLAANDDASATQPTYIVLFAGPDTLYRISNLLSEVNQKWGVYEIPLYVVYVEHKTASNSSFADYRSLAEQGHGEFFHLYQSDGTTQEFTAFDGKFFAPLSKERVTYEVEYRSTSGASGVRNVDVRLNGQVVQATGENVFTYSIALGNPIVTLQQPVDGAVVNRTALQDLGGSFAYDLDTQTINFKISWPDGFPRSLSSVDLEITTPIGVESVSIPVGTGSTFSYEWDLRELSQEGDNPVDVRVLITDELDLSSESGAVSLLVTNTVPVDILTSVISEEMEAKLEFTNYLAYGLAGIVLILIIALIVMRKKIKQIGLKGIGNAIVQQVRKTFIPNSGNKQPNATLKIISGPESLEGQELKIFTEDVKLGRDPAQVDFTFYSPDAKTTVSSVHAQIRRNNGIWLLENHSSSGETVLNGNRIPDVPPSELHDGDQIRLGSLAQQCVEFVFMCGGNNSSGSGNSPKKTDVMMNPADIKEISVVRKTDVPKPNFARTNEQTVPIRQEVSEECDPFVPMEEPTIVSSVVEEDFKINSNVEDGDFFSQFDN